MQKRKLASNLILFLFFLLVSFAALFSDIFQNPIKNGSGVILQDKLFSINDLAKIQRISLKNKSGEYLFERTQNSQTPLWQMISPRDIPANSSFLLKLMNALSSIKIIKNFPDEKLNISNFSIDKPTSTLNLTEQNGHVTTIVFGLMNTIDNSTYLKISGRNGIFHVEAPNVQLENASVADLIESQIISINLETTVNFKIFRGNKKNGKPQLEIIKDAENWYDHEKNLLSNEKVNEYLQELLALRSSFIIDKQTDAQKRQITNLGKNAEYIISIEDNKANITDYNISGIIRDLSDIDLKHEEYFIVTASNNTTSHIVKKEFHEVFERRSDLFKVAPVKKSETIKNLK